LTLRLTNTAQEVGKLLSARLLPLDWNLVFN
jgi:hypothetical protein